MGRVVLVFLKFPEPGKVKTRLAAAIGEEAAAKAYRQLVCRVIEQSRAAQPDRLVVAYDPPEKEAEIRKWIDPWLRAFPREVGWLPQSGADLGERLTVAMESEYTGNPGAELAIVGTDCVHLDQSIFEETWSALEGDADVVFGPSEDGGYYLVAMKQPQVALFRDIPWSSSTTLEASRAAAASAGLVDHLLPTRFDVDEETEWERVVPEVSDRRCVFFDRDGVVNESPGDGYVLRWEDFHLQEGIAEALQWLREHDILSILVTSQKGVGKGLMGPDELHRIHRNLQAALADAGACFDAIYAFTGEPDCPHRPKPDPEMIETACESFFIDPRQSWMIGDADRDIAMGKSAGLQGTIRVRSEKTIGIEADHTIDHATQIRDILQEVL